MRNKTFLLIVALLLLTFQSVMAGNENRIGTAGAAELLISVGSRGTAMGGAVVANSYGLDAIYWNPAGLAWLEGTEAMASILPYIADIDVTYFAIGKHLEDFGSLALSVKVVSAGKIEETTEALPNGTGSVFEPTMAVIGLTFAKAVSTQVNFGITGRYIRENIFEVSASGLSFDFGFTYEPRIYGLTLGLAIRNYGPDIVFSGSGFERLDANNRPVSSSDAGAELPTSIDLGLAYNFMNNGLNSATMSTNFRSNNLSNDNFNGGLEYVYDERYSLRAGYLYSSNENFLYGFSLGAGVSVDLGEDARLTFEYSWTDTEVFNSNQYFTMKASF
ncbi:MAG: PorV/PorQ family protein [candidate division Zixibacteria bacterium]|nr:PorV/PorQ family protein [candidate division Zixibacteria bacterium]